jgi:hypothetical protein
MTRISMLIPEKELAAIDEVASPNRTAFMIGAAMELVARKRHERLQAEIDACLSETASEDLSLLEEFAETAADGL